MFLALTARADTCDFVTRAVRSDCTLTWNGLTRQYQLYIPTAYVANTSGVVIGLHGSQGSGPNYPIGVDPTIIGKADAAGFAVVVPSATNPPGNTGIWQFDGGADGGSSFLWTSRGASVPDDMGFLRQLIAVIKSGINPDPNRIYVAGFSVGGEMTHAVGIQLSDVVAAIGVDEGIFPFVDPTTAPSPLAPISVLMFHGSASLFLTEFGGL